MNLAELRNFVAIARAGSLSRAAEESAVPRSTLSKRLQMLEASLGVRLIERNTRAFRLTEDGLLLLDRAAVLIEDARELEQIMRTRHDRPHGRLRVCVPQLFGALAIGPIAVRYRERWPETTVEVVLTDRKVDLIDEGFDCAIRTGLLEDSDMISRTVATSTAIVVASSDRASAIDARSPEDLNGQPAIGFGMPAGPGRWVLRDGDREVAANVRVVLAFSGIQAVLAAAVAGGGLAILPDFVARPAIDSGALKRVLRPWTAGEHPLQIVYPSRRHLSARTRAFIDMVEQEMSEWHIR
jgi:DNA-binding transcriptional LysR family regulator